MGQTLGDAIAFLEANYPDEVIRVTREVDPIFEVTGILAKLERQQQFPCVIFEHVKGSSIPLVTNMHASFPRLAMAIGLPYDATPADFIHEYGRREANPVPPVDVDSGPCQEVVLTGDDVDVTMLPILQYHELDAGRYITLAFNVMKEPDTGIRNAGIYRLQLKGRNRFGIQISETAHGHYILKKNKSRGLPTQMAAVIGGHPAMNIGNLSFTSIDTDEFSIAGAMLGKPVELVKCKTIDVEVPASAEIVLECEIHPTEMEEEAPFGEYPGTYGPPAHQPRGVRQGHHHEEERALPELVRGTRRQPAAVGGDAEQLHLPHLPHRQRRREGGVRAALRALPIHLLHPDGLHDRRRCQERRHGGLRRGSFP